MASEKKVTFLCWFDMEWALNDILKADENTATLEDIDFWLEDEEDPGWPFLTEEVIVESMMKATSFEEDGDYHDEAIDTRESRPNHGEVKVNFNFGIKYIKESKNESISRCYEYLKHLHELINHDNISK